MLKYKIASISNRLKLPEKDVAMILYLYLTDCCQDILIHGKTKTLFGEMYLNEKDDLTLSPKKGGLIELLDKKDIKVIKKICEEGPDWSIF